MLNFDKSIKDVIIEYPIIGDFLLANDIDCANCSLGSCLLKDVLEIHNYDEKMQQEMNEYMAQLVNGEVEELKIFAPQETKQEYSRIIKRLMDEHQKILEMVYIAEYITRQEDYYSKYREEIDEMIVFFKEYADEFHHGKEEDVLFKYFEKIEILEVMYQEHELSRSMRTQLIEATGNDLKIKALLAEYGTMLKDHINKEDTILFPYLDRKLTSEQLEAIDKELDKVDYTIESDLERFVREFNKKEFNM
ncbi:MAG: hemerythrin domain-containing protein [Erysipelotrichales bacterium]